MFGRMIFVLVDEKRVFVALCLVTEEVIELCDVLIKLETGLTRLSMFSLLNGQTFEIVVE